jgi:hypothetical protein
MAGARVIKLTPPWHTKLVELSRHALLLRTAIVTADFFTSGRPRECLTPVRAPKKIILYYLFYFQINIPR